MSDNKKKKPEYTEATHNPVNDEITYIEKTRMDDGSLKVTKKET